MKVYAVIDTNVIVSALLTKKVDVATAKVFRAFQQRDIILLYNDEILDEYRNVLSRPKLHLSASEVYDIMNFVIEEGVLSARLHSTDFFPDPKDVVFYEVALSKEDAYLVTGNTKHFPSTPIVVTPAEMVEILEQGQRKGREVGETFLK